MSSRIEVFMNNTKLKYTTVATILFMLAAHMYAYTNGSLLFDAIGVYRGGPVWNVITDRWLINIYWIIDLGVNEPWLAGLWSIFLMIISVYCLCESLNIYTRKGIIIVAGLCSTQSAIICQNEYTGQNFYGIIALMWASVGALMLTHLEEQPLRNGILGILCIIASSATYGSYVSIVPTIIMFNCVENILQGKKAKENLKDLLVRLSLFFFAMALYYLVFRVLYHLFGTEITSYMGKDSMTSSFVFLSMASSIVDAYKSLMRYYLGIDGAVPFLISRIQLMALILGTIIFLSLFVVKFKKINDRLYNITLCMILVLVLPMSINLIYIMAQGNVHFLMIFTYCIPFLFFIRVSELFGEYCISNEVRFNRRIILFVYNVVLILLIYYSVVMSNAIYIRLQNMYDVSQSISTRILDRVETTEGFDGTEDIIIVGALQNDSYWGTPGKQDAMILNGMIGPVNPNNINGINYASWTQRFIKNVMWYSGTIDYYKTYEDCVKSEGFSEDEIDKFNEMGCFPRANSVQKIGDKIYVKFVSE